MKLEFDQKRSTLNAQKYVINLIQKILSSDYTCAVMASLAPVVFDHCPFPSPYPILYYSKGQLECDRGNDRIVAI